MACHCIKEIMRLLMTLFITLALFINLLLLAYGQGFFGTAPADTGRAYSPKPFFNHAEIQIKRPVSSS